MRLSNVMLSSARWRVGSKHSRSKMQGGHNTGSIHPRGPGHRLSGSNYWPHRCQWGMADFGNGRRGSQAKRAGCMS